MAPEQKNIKVAVRVRPYNRHELEQSQQRIVRVLDKKMLLFDPEEEDDEFFYQGTKQNYRDITKRTHKKLSMEFDRVFDTEATNTEIFHECMMPLVDSVLNGYNCSVFVYGATGAGKTFTMLGNATSAGLTFLTMHDLFAKVQAQSDSKKFDVGVSYLEVYNEHVMNLLSKTGPLKLLEDSNGVVVSGLVLKPIRTADGLLEMLALGNANRTQHPTDANAESSRSHAVFQVHIRMTDRQTGTKRTVKLSMIDLAGSERAASTKGIGLRFKEGASINKSLLALGNCINKLADGLKHIPYRDSNLTRLLKDSLGGNCQTLMVANISMSSLTYEDTLNTLKYASRAKKIRTTLRQNVMRTNMPKDFYIKKVVELMAENECLKEEIARREHTTNLTQNMAAATVASDDSEQLKPWYNRINNVYSTLLTTQECMLGIQSKIKNLNLKSKHSKQIEHYKQMLMLDDGILSEETNSTISAQIELEQVELSHWRKKLQAAQRDLRKLNHEIEDSSHARTLLMYKHGKDQEIEIAKSNFTKSHGMLIYNELIDNVSRLRAAFTNACKIVNSLAKNFDTEQREQYENIVQALNTQNGGSLRKNAANEEKSIQLLLNGNSFPATNELLAKRPRYRTPCSHQSDYDLVLDAPNEDGDFDDAEHALNTAIFKVPGKLTKLRTASEHKLNETHGVLTESGLNTTFDCAKKTNTQYSNKKQLVNDILSEHLVRVSNNRDHLKNALLKSKQFNHQGMLRTVAVGVQKENKQKCSPGKVRKSPRSHTIKAFSGATNSIRIKQTALTLHPDCNAGSSKTPTVRINRAASFRFKK